MNENQLSKRLARVGQLIPEGSRLADIGSDHAYLPVWLMLQGKIAFAVAGEVVTGPFESAQKQVRKSGLSEGIVVRLADGLDAVQPQDKIDVVSICGMGGALITDILEKGRQQGRLTGSELLVLQPNVGEQGLRLWLMRHGYQIIEEDILEENHKIYEILVAARGSQPVAYSQDELLFGPKLLHRKGQVFKKKWRRELEQRKHVARQLEKSSADQQTKIEQLNQEMARIEEVL